MTTHDMLLAAIAAEPDNPVHRLVYADWLEEHGDPLAYWWQGSEPQRLVETPVFNGDGNGYGDGYGDGDGYGYGNGNGYGDGDGYGNGDGYGDGDGYGYGTNGYGDGEGKLPERWNPMCEVGKRQIIVLPHAWVICGDVVQQTGPFSFAVENASVICRTGGTPWDKLADGEGRAMATFRTWGRVTISNPFLCREWKGELPS
jgi:uncharacterized protein (TIGR02996 family)